MTDSMSPDVPRQKTGPLKRGCQTCAEVFGLLLLIFFVMSMSARSALDTRFEGVKKNVEARRVEAAKPRPVLLGKAREGNAADYYNGLEWAWGEDLDDRLKTNPPQLAPGAIEDRQRFEGMEFYFPLNAELTTHMNGGDPPSDAALAQFETWRPLLHYAREGLLQDHCDWQFEWGRSIAGRIPNLLLVRCVAVTMAYEAFLTEDPVEAARIGLEIMALGDDMSRHPTLIAAMIGISVKGMGVASLERTLARHALPKESYEQILGVVGKLQRSSMVPYLDIEVLSFNIFIVTVQGERIADLSIGVHKTAHAQAAIGL